ncbi:HEAT repeat domain-containing protein [Ktedonosporobacter rubrisoli]|uniref:HEAT repeat domain-containing protein n=1 Tax=Ktedonosporobacter rubrisoli TaxID=2509675 RepID=A0A4P6JWF8_KTERU|nr:HEAT repeat domain-containing protein [Ktedonosporobacter rubrisoli]QBD79904.1 HEAT repeat domain-containing protein [Ktedonosporobacter rubrisoli]
MADHELEKPVEQDDIHTEEATTEPVMVPETLLPTVLQHLGLRPEETLSEIPVDTLVSRLKSANWEERVAAVRALGKLDSGASIELLMSVLHDEDEAVRAATIHALGNMGKRVPLHVLENALNDENWHVREAAIFALVKQGQRVSRTTLASALHDRDNEVREAAHMALQWHTQDNTPVYGVLREQQPLSTPPAAQASSYESSTSSEAPSEAQGRQEQIQAYVLQDDEQAAQGMYMRHGQKITDLPRHPKSPKHWWLILILVALLCFGLGCFMGQLHIPAPPATIGSMAASNPKEQDISFERAFLLSKYTYALQKSIADGLHMSPEQVTALLEQKHSLEDIAGQQHISAEQLHKIEQKAFQDLANAAVQRGDLDQQLAREWVNRISKDPNVMDKLATEAFMNLPLSAGFSPGLLEGR